MFPFTEFTPMPAKGDRTSEDYHQFFWEILYNVMILALCLCVAGAVVQWLF